MFTWKIKRMLQDQPRELAVPADTYAGANRRAINLVPVPQNEDGHELAQTSKIRYHHLLISIEGKQRTCVLKIISPRKKSRSALLVFRGRVMGCLYGKKGLNHHLFEREAHDRALTDLASPGNILDAYQLPEELALAAASLFHGQVLEFSRSMSPQQIYETAIQQIVSFGLPGAVVVSSEQNEMVCMVFIANGRILGLYSSADGWVGSNQQMAHRYLAQFPNAKVMGSILPIRTLDDAVRIGFSLTGLGDRRFELYKPAARRTEQQPLRPTDYWEVKVAQAVTPVHYSRSQRVFSHQYPKHAHAIHP